MWKINLTTIATVLLTTVAVTGGGLLAQQPMAPKSARPVDVAAANSKPADSAAMAETEAKLAKLRELSRQQPGEHVTTMAKIAWKRDPWAGAVKAGKEGKPVLVYAEGAAGIACGYG